MGCGCLVVLLGSFAPRIALALVWVFTDRVTAAFNATSFFVPLLGLVFLPYTTLFYVLVYSPITHVQGLGWFIVFLGFLLDLGSYTGGGYEQRRRRSAAA